MPFDAEPLSHARIKATLGRFFPTKVAEFITVLISTNSMLMGSLPLFSLKSFWATWDMPGDVDVFLPPTSSDIMFRSIYAFQVFFVACGYKKKNTKPRLQIMKYPPHFSVVTYTKDTFEGILQVQLITRAEDPRTPEWMLPSSEWYLGTMQEFDIACCSVAYDGHSFYVTPDNPDPTNPVTFTRGRTTQQRYMKYEQRGFIFALRIIVPIAHYRRFVILCIALLRAFLELFRR